MPSWVLHLARALPGTVHLADKRDDSFDNDWTVAPRTATAYTAFFAIGIRNLPPSILHVSEVTSATVFFTDKFIPVVVYSSHN